MPLNFNGTDVETVIYNGVELDEVIYNGVIVYQKSGSISDDTLIYVTKNTEDMVAPLLTIIKNDTEETNFYLNDQLKSTLTTAGTVRSSAIVIPAGESILKITGGTFYIDSSFSSTPNLVVTKIVLGRNYVGKVGTAFSNSGLVEAVIGPNVTEVALGGPETLTSVVLHEGISSIGEGCFNGSDIVGPVRIPSTVTSIGAQAFISNKKITEFIFSTNNPQLTTIGNSAFRNCSGITTAYNLPPTVTELGTYVFDTNSYVKSIILSNSNCKMNTYLCRNCVSLENLYVASVVAPKSRATSVYSSWVTSCNDSDFVIHLSRTLDLTSAKELFGPYFNYKASGQECAVVFDI